MANIEKRADWKNDEEFMKFNNMMLKEKFTFDHYFFDFFSVIFGFISLKIFGDRNYNNWINKFAFKLDVVISKIPFLHVLFARVIIYGQKK